jgi:hypothetical protein
MRIDCGMREGEGMAGCFLERRFSKTIWSGVDIVVCIGWLVGW